MIAKKRGPLVERYVTELGSIRTCQIYFGKTLIIVCVAAYPPPEEETPLSKITKIEKLGPFPTLEAIESLAFSGHHQQAIDNLRDIEASPDNAHKIQRLKAYALSGIGQRDDSFLALKSLIDSKLGSIDDIYAISEKSIEMGRYNEAENYATDVIQLSNEIGDDYYLGSALTIRAFSRLLLGKNVLAREDAVKLSDETCISWLYGQPCLTKKYLLSKLDGDE